MKRARSPGTYYEPKIEEHLHEGVRASTFPFDEPLLSSPAFDYPYVEGEGDEFEAAVGRLIFMPPKRVKKSKKRGDAGHVCVIGAGTSGVTFTLAVVRPTGEEECLRPMLDEMGTGFEIIVPPEEITLFFLRLDFAARRGVPDALVTVAAMEFAIGLAALARAQLRSVLVKLLGMRVEPPT